MTDFSCRLLTFLALGLSVFSPPADFAFGVGPGPETVFETIELGPPPEPERRIKIIPVPAFSTTRNEGETYGVLAAFLFTNPMGQIDAIMAPFVVYNEIMGMKSAWQVFGYLPGDRDFVAKVSYSTKINRELRLEFKDPSFYYGRFSLELGVQYFKESTARFYGLTQESRNADETNYTLRDFSSRFVLGKNIGRTLNLSLTESFRQVEIQLGGVSKLPFIAGTFPEVDGLDGATIVGHRLTLTHDRRDDRTTPTQGKFLSLYSELGHIFRNGHGIPFTRHGFQAKGWFPLDDKRVVMVPNLQLQAVSGSKVPFFERSTLGGEDTLRAFGLGRFVDDHFILVNLEGRIRVSRLKIMGVVSEQEVAPFVDMGRVFSTFRRDFFDDWAVNPGLGLRIIVRPNVVGRLDVAFGREGTTFFVGLNFPF